MNNSYKFMLAGGYCLYKGVCVIKQRGSVITFLIEDLENQNLKENITHAFLNYVDYVKKQNNCPEYFKQLPEVYFKKGFRKQLKKIIAKQNSKEVF